MLNELERQYRSGLSEQRFWNYYIIRAVAVVAIAISGILILNLNIWITASITAVILFLFVGRFFQLDIARVVGKRRPKHWRQLLEVYAAADKELRQNILLDNLRQDHIYTKDDLRLIIEFYEHRQPLTTKTSLLEWILSIIITLVSIVAIAYDDSLQTIDSLKLLHILLPSVRIAVLILVPATAIGYLSSKIFFSRSKIDTILIEDLTEIYLNFDQFQDIL